MAPSWIKTCSRAAAVAIAGALCLIYAYWPQFRSGFTIHTGDHYDGIIALAIHEHWFNVLRGLAPWDKVPWFHPTPGTLAYCEGFLLHGLVYAAGRAIGLHPFLAADVAQIALKALGFVGVFMVGRRFLALGPGMATFAAALSTVIGSLVIEAYHSQFAALGPGVLAVWFGLESARALLSGRRGVGLAWGAAGAATYGAVLLSSFYVAWALGLLALAATAVVFAVRPRRSLAALRPTRGGLASVAALAALLLLAVAPALALYLPITRITGLHGLGQVRGLAMGPAGLINLGAGSLAWGWLAPWLAPFKPGPAPHGIAPLLLLTTVIGTVFAARAALHRTRPEAPLVFALGTAGLGLCLLTVDWGWVWPWLAVWHTVPGAGAFRVTSRVLMLVSPALVLVAAWWVARLAERRPAAPWAAPLAAVLAGVLLVEQGQTHNAPLDSRVELARLARLPPTPAGCTVFAAARPREGRAVGFVAGLYSHNADAMLVAALRNLPTINGVSTFFPPDWDLADPNGRDYGGRVHAHAVRHGFGDSLCGLDLHDLVWTGPGQPIAWDRAPPPEPAPVRPGEPAPTTSANPAAATWLIEGWAERAPGGAWSLGERALLRLRLPPAWPGGTLVLDLTAFAPRTGRRETTIVVTPGETANRVTLAHGVPTKTELRLPASTAEEIVTVALLVPDPETPAGAGLGDDRRPLGVSLSSLQLRPDGG